MALPRPCEHGVVERHGLGKHAAVLAHEVVTAKDKVLRGLAPPGTCVQVGADKPGARSAHKGAPVVGLAHELVGGRQVAHERGTSLGEGGRGRLGHPQVLADLDGNHELGQLVAGKEQVRAKGHLPVRASGRQLRQAQAREGHPRRLLGARREVPALVELVVGRDVALGHEAKQLAVAHHGRAVEELGGRAHRHAHEREGVQLGRLAHEASKARHGGVEQGVLPEEVLAGVGRERKLGQDDDACALRHRVAGRRHAGLHVVVHVRHANGRRDRRNLHESVSHARSLPGAVLPPVYKGGPVRVSGELLAARHGLTGTGKALEVGDEDVHGRVDGGVLHEVLDDRSAHRAGAHTVARELEHLLRVLEACGQHLAREVVGAKDVVGV